MHVESVYRYGLARPGLLDIHMTLRETRGRLEAETTCYQDAPLSGYALLILCDQLLSETYTTTSPTIVPLPVFLSVLDNLAHYPSLTHRFRAARKPKGKLSLPGLYSGAPDVKVKARKVQLLSWVAQRLAWHVRAGRSVDAAIGEVVVERARMANAAVEHWETTNTINRRVNLVSFALQHKQL